MGNKAQEEEFKKKIAKIFKEAREKKGWSQVEVAKKAKISVGYYYRIESVGPMPRADVLDRITNALEINLKLPLK